MDKRFVIDKVEKGYLKGSSFYFCFNIKEKTDDKYNFYKPLVVYAKHLGHEIVYVQEETPGGINLFRCNVNDIIKMDYNMDTRNMEWYSMKL
jgi:hypothetical protein